MRTAEQWPRAVSLQSFSDQAGVEELAETDPFREDRSDAILFADVYLRLVAAIAPDHRDELIAQFDSLLHRTDERQDLVDVVIGAALKLLLDFRPVWRDITDIVSLTPDGVRPATIVRLASTLPTLPFEVLPNLQKSHSDGTLPQEIEEFCKAALPMIGLVRNDAFEGVDGNELFGGAAHPTELGITETSYQSSGDFRSIDFLYADVKERARNLAAKRLEKRGFHGLHRLLSEDALIQQTISLRHLDNTSLQSIRPWRRQLSAIFHGLQSIPVSFDENGQGAIVDDDFGTRVLTSCPRATQFWIYLYGFAYRRMIERPPAWNLSRLYGLDDLKTDILLNFDKPWRLWPGGFRDSGFGRPEQGLIASLSARDPSLNHLMTDYRQSLAQSYLAVGSVTKAKNVLFPDRRTKSQVKNGYSDDCSHADFKRAFEIDLLKGDKVPLDLVAARASKALNVSGKEGGLCVALAHAIETATDGIHKALHSPDGGVANTDFLSFPIVDEISSRLRAQERPDIADTFGKLHDIYSRMGEYEATRADLATASEFLDFTPEGGVAGELDLGMMQDFGGSADVSRGIDLAFSRSFAHLVLAEQCRLRAFREEPLGSEYFASGNSARQLIRVALKLEGRRAKRLGQTGPAFGIFARQARRTADTLTRNLFRYPRERAAQIIIEATLLRLLSNPENRQNRLQIADGFLREAEALVVGLGRRVRVRMRLQLERAKLNRAFMQDLEINGEEGRARLLQWEYDVDALETLASETDMPLWQTLSKLQRNSLERFSKAKGL